MDSKLKFKGLASLILLLILAVLSSCTTANTPELSPLIASPTAPLPTDTIVPSATFEATATQVPTNTPQPTQTTVPDLPPIQYDLSAQLDYGWKVVNAVQAVTIPHPTDHLLNEIVLVVQPNWYPGTFQLGSISWSDGASIDNYILDGIQLSIPLDEPWQPGTVKNLDLEFTLNLPPMDRGEEFGPNPFGYTSRQVNLTDWHPFVPPFVDGEWLVHHPWYYGEHLVYPLADFTAELSLVNAPESTVIAANGLDHGQDGIHQYTINQARNFVWSVSHEYYVSEAEVDGVTLLSYGFPFDAEIGQAAFEATIEAFRLYTEIFGPYPHESLTMVQADFLHGMEYDGLYYLSKAFYNTYDGTPASYLVTIAVHETAHQWWFGLVGNDQALEPWLDEAFCTFTERLYYENLHPEALQWWLDYRVDYYDPQGWVDLTIYDSGGYRPYRDAVYLNGMNFLTELRDLVGEEAFMEFLRDYLARQSRTTATSADFFDILSLHTDADWSLVKARYFKNP